MLKLWLSYAVTADAASQRKCWTVQKIYHKSSWKLVTWPLKPLSHTEDVKGWWEKRLWRALSGLPPSPKVKKEEWNRWLKGLSVGPCRLRDTGSWCLTPAWERLRRREVLECCPKGAKWGGGCPCSSCGLRCVQGKSHKLSRAAVGEGCLKSVPASNPPCLPLLCQLEAQKAGSYLVAHGTQPGSLIFSAQVRSRQARTSELGLGPALSLVPCLWPPTLWAGLKQRACGSLCWSWRAPLFPSYHLHQDKCPLRFVLLIAPPDPEASCQGHDVDTPLCDLSLLASGCPRSAPLTFDKAQGWLSPEHGTCWERTSPCKHHCRHNSAWKVTAHEDNIQHGASQTVTCTASTWGIRTPHPDPGDLGAEESGS